VYQECVLFRGYEIGDGFESQMQETILPAILITEYEN